MKAVYIERFGGPEVLKYGDLPDPIAGPGEVVVDVVAASINAADWKVRAGQNPQTKFPFALGRDFSGLVSALGEGVTDFRVGDAVFGVCATGQEGAYAEKIAVSAAMPAFGTLRQFAALPSLNAVGWGSTTMELRSYCHRLTP